MAHTIYRLEVHQQDAAEADGQEEGGGGTRSRRHTFVEFAGSDVDQFTPDTAENRESRSHLLGFGSCCDDLVSSASRRAKDEEVANKDDDDPFLKSTFTKLLKQPLTCSKVAMLATVTPHVGCHYETFATIQCALLCGNIHTITTTPTPTTTTIALAQSTKNKNATSSERSQRAQDDNDE